MTHLRFPLAVLAAALILPIATPAEAGPPFGRDCPPGLAKKNPPCVPPGLARQGLGSYRIGVGDYLRHGDYVRLRDPHRYGLRAAGDELSYYIVQDMIVRADPRTLRVLAVIGLADALLN